jgi:hypothetical protein
MEVIGEWGGGHVDAARRLNYGYHPVGKYSNIPLDHLLYERRRQTWPGANQNEPYDLLGNTRRDALFATQQFPSLRPMPKKQAKFLLAGIHRLRVPAHRARNDGYEPGVAGRICTRNLRVGVSQRRERSADATVAKRRHGEAGWEVV